MKNNLQKLRKKKQISQNDIANLLGVTRQAISLYEQGKRQLKEKDVSTLTKYFGVTKTYLLGAYSKEEIAKLVQDEYKDQYDNKDKPLFPLVVHRNGLPASIVDNYFISIGAIPYDIKQESYLLSPDRIDNLDFWLKNLEPIYEKIAPKWLINKPSLNASEKDVLSAVRDAMSNIISESAISYTNPELARQERTLDNQNFAKRLKFLNEHIEFEDETFEVDGQKYSQSIPYFDWSKLDD